MPPIPETSSDQRDVPLEALRGFAALSVIAWHFSLGLWPELLADQGYGFYGTPLYAFIHGTAAVSVFFVLSGFVLTRRYFETGKKRVLIIGALKRWFRLILPIFLSVMLSWIFFYFDFYAYEDAANVSHSAWLYSFGYAMRPPFDPSFVAAVTNGFSEIFYHNNNAFNPPLWTMHIEMMGSYVAFGFATLIAGLRGQTLPIVFITIVIVLVAQAIDPFLIAFVPGTLLAFYAPRLTSISNAKAISALLLGIVFLGYRDPIGLYSFLDFLEPVNGEPLRAITSTIGATFLMIAFIGWQPLRRRLQGPAARLLGRLSFPIYLVHFILICSLGSAVYVIASEGNSNGAALAITALILIPAILAAAAVFAAIDMKWIAFVNSIFRKVKIPG